MSVSAKRRTVRIKVVGDGPSRLILARTANIGAESIPTIVRWSFLLFTLSLAFETVSLGFTSSSFSTGRFAGFLLVGTYFFHCNPFLYRRSFPSVPRAMWWFLGYVAVYAINGFFIPEDAVGDWRTRLMTLVQLMVLFWIASSLFEEDRMARSVLLTYAIAVSIVALGILADVPGFSDPTQVAAADERETGLGVGANALGAMMALAALMLVGLFLNLPMGKIRRRMLLVSMLPALVLLAKTGSRGAVVAFVAGSLVYLLPFLQRKRRLAAIVLASIGLVTVLYMIGSNPYIWERWKMTYYEGNLASREEIYPAAVEMVLERPVFGWHGAEFIYELGRRLNVPSGKRDTHNLVLWILLEVGLVGAIPFFMGLFLCGLAAWKARTGNLGLLPLALLLTILVNNMSVTFFTNKLMWLICALCVAAGSGAAKNGGKQFVFALEGKSLRLADRARMLSHSVAEHQNQSRA